GYICSFLCVYLGLWKVISMNVLPYQEDLSEEQTFYAFSSSNISLLCEVPLSKTKIRRASDRTKQS
ncbi:MAG: hypothetical protein AAGK05_08805, partial [Pseudomonadota bacterium]